LPIIRTTKINFSQ